MGKRTAIDAPANLWISRSAAAQLGSRRTASTRGTQLRAIKSMGILEASIAVRLQTIMDTRHAALAVNTCNHIRCFHKPRQYRDVYVKRLFSCRSCDMSRK